MLDNTEEAIMKGQSKDTGNFGYTRRRTKTNNTTNTIQKTKKMSHTKTGAEPRCSLKYIEISKYKRFFSLERS
jgi:hypothetical protein